MDCGRVARTLRVKVTAGSSRREVIEMSDGSLKVRVRSVPEKGKANREMLEVLAGHLGVPASCVSIVSGHTAREKIVRVYG